MKVDMSGYGEPFTVFSIDETNSTVKKERDKIGRDKTS
jgi:hypothetical protein